MHYSTLEYTSGHVLCTCRRPTARHGHPIIQDPPVDNDEDDFRERDYDISTMANNLNREVYRYGIFDNDDGEEVCSDNASAVQYDRACVFYMSCVS